MTIPKHPKLHHETQAQEQQPLIPGLPDDVALLCLSKAPPSTLFRVCRRWRRLLYSPLFPPFLSLYALLSPSPLSFASFDPLSSKWSPLPPPPFPLLLSHPSFISRTLPVQSLSSSSHLLVVAATSPLLLPSLPHPLLFSPSSPSWSFAPPLPVPRRWCASSSLRGSLFIASGVGSHFSSHTARSLHRWDLSRGGASWVRAKGLKDGRFSREGVAAVGWRGKLWVVNVATKQGAVYEPEEDEWGEMAPGMVEGWKGAVAALEEEGELYGVEEGKGVLRRYEEERDCWVDVVEDERLVGAHQMTAAAGKLCVVSGGGSIVVVDVVAEPPKVWVVEPPDGFKAVAVHVLPRMSWMSGFSV